jgi:hypothetical protein
VRTTNLIELVKLDGTAHTTPTYVAAEIAGRFTKSPYEAVKVDDLIVALVMASMCNRLFPQEAHGSQWKAVEHAFG